MVAPWELAAGVAADLLLGDPRWWPHPIRGLGWAITRLERFFRSAMGATRVSGVALWLSVVTPACLVVWLSPRWLHVFWIWSFLALRSLDLESTRVLAALDAGDLVDARRRLSRIVGRDTENLNDEGVRRAVIETMSENMSDGVIAPLFYLVLAGPAGMAVYKAVNTLDSMVGYRNKKYRRMGWFSARADDVLNWIPARLSALFIWAAAALLGLDARASIAVTLRDAKTQPSPNAGYPEAAFAGALGVRLGGVSRYQGLESRKAYLGDGLRPLDRQACLQARRLLYAASFAGFISACAGLWVAQ